MDVSKQTTNYCGGCEERQRELDEARATISRWIDAYDGKHRLMVAVGDDLDKAIGLLCLRPGVEKHADYAWESLCEEFVADVVVDGMREVNEDDWREER